MKRYCIIRMLLLMGSLVFVLVLTACTSPSEPQSWETGRAVAFSGYVYGGEGSKTFLQLPIFFKGNQAGLTTADISAISLVGEDVELECELVGAAEMIYDEDRDCSLTTLKFRAILPQKGQYIADRLRISLHNGRDVMFELSAIHFYVDKPFDWKQPLSAEEYWLNQADCSSVTVTYKNESDHEVEVCGLSLSGGGEIETVVEMYIDADMTLKEDGTRIPPGESRTFVFRFLTSQDYGDFLYYLPALTYIVDGKEVRMPFQPQALVIQMPFSDEFVSALLKE